MDHYKAHLAEVSAENSVVATEDICNAQGQIIVPKGRQIDQTAADRIVRFKLLKPVEHSVAIENELVSESLYKAVTDYMCADKSLFELYLQSDQGALLNRCCAFACSFAVIRQKVTILRLEFPHLFQQTLFVCWLTMVIQSRLGADDDTIKQSFLAALTRDLGLLHIDPSIIHEDGELNEEQYKQLISHPVISQKIVEHLQGVKPVASRAVAEHHENLDGTGFPAGKLGSALEPLGQILNLLDSTYAIYTKYYKPVGRTLADLIPVIKMNSRVHFGDFSEHFINLLRGCSTTSTAKLTDHSISDMIGSIKQCNGYISNYMKTAYQLISDLASSGKGPHLTALQKAYIHIHKSVTQSGLINDAYIRWLDQVDAEKIQHAYRETEDAYLMMREVIYQIEKLNIQLSNYVVKKGKATTEKTPGLFENLLSAPAPQMDAAFLSA